MPPCKNTKGALKPIEVFLIVVIGLPLVLIMGVLVPAGRTHSGPSAVDCASNLKQMGLALRLYAEDYNGRFPTEKTNSLLEPDPAQLLVRTYQTISNELSNPRILFCPLDNRAYASNFTVLKSTNISYFLSFDARYVMTNAITAGDRQMEVSKQRLQPGFFTVTSNMEIHWSRELRHKSRRGNLLFSDGSVEMMTPNVTDFVKAEQIPTNRLVIP